MNNYQVIFKNTLDRMAFIGLHIEYFTLPNVTFETTEWNDDEYPDAPENGQPMISVNDGNSDLSFGELESGVGYAHYESLLFNFTYLTHVPGSDHKLVDFTSGDDTGL